MLKDIQMVTAADLIMEAREWIGTPWITHQRAKGVGADCGGFILGCLWALDYPPARGYDYKDYSQMPDTASLRRVCDDLLDRSVDYAPGDIVLMRMGRDIQHLGIIGDGFGGLSLIHSYVSVGRTVENRIDDAWARRIVQSFRLRAVTV